MSKPAVTRLRLNAAPCGAPAEAAAETKVCVQSRRFGELQVGGERIVRFVRPVIGFHNLEHYAVVEEEESAPILWMQAFGAPDVLLPVVDAGRVTKGYSVDLTDEEVAALALERAEDARLLLVLTLSPDPSAITANLRAPIVWNTRRATAMQLVLEESGLPFSHSIGGKGAECRSNKEVARARPHTSQE